MRKANKRGVLRKTYFDNISHISLFQKLPFFHQPMKLEKTRNVILCCQEINSLDLIFNVNKVGCSLYNGSVQGGNHSPTASANVPRLRPLVSH